MKRFSKKDQDLDLSLNFFYLQVHGRQKADECGSHKGQVCAVYHCSSGVIAGRSVCVCVCVCVFCVHMLMCVCHCVCV